MEPEQYPGLEINHHPRQQRREWTVERIAWLLLLALLVAIACGLFGRGGPLSKVETTSADGSFRIEYNRFVRYHSPDMLRITVRAASDKVRVKLDSRYAGHIDLERITPTPEQEIADDGSITYLFNTRPNAEVAAAFHFSPEKYGSLSGWVAVNDKPRQPFFQFVYP